MRVIPQVQPFYAVKCNPEPALLQTLANRLVDFDCASLNEVYSVKNLYWASDRAPKILYAHPLKSERDIRMINDMGICSTVVDSVEETEKMAKCGWKGVALVRVAVGDKGSKMPFSSKFGATIEEVEEICKVAKAVKIPLVGASFHVGSGCEDVTQYTKAMKYVVTDVFDRLKAHEHKTKILDIGGGFSADQYTFQSAAAAIRNGLEYVTQTTRVIAEPGRYFAQPSQDLFVKVIAKKPGPNGWRYVIDESLYGHFSCIPFDHQTPGWVRVPMTNKEEPREKHDATLFGRTCDSLDVIAKGKMERLEVGDWLWFPMMGAYTSATASEFNGFPKPNVLIDNYNELPVADFAWGVLKAALAGPNLKFSNSLEPLR